MIKNAAVEDSGITDKEHGTEIYVTTTSRVRYRKLNPEWQKVSNKTLNKVIAEQFSTSTMDSTFRPKKAAPGLTGEVRIASGVKFISLVYSGQVIVIDVKGNPRISAPPSLEKPAYRQFSLSKQAERNDFARSNRGFLENHFFDLFQSAYALDSRAIDLIKDKYGKDAADVLQNLGSGEDDMDDCINNMLEDAGYFEPVDEPDLKQRATTIVFPLNKA